ncbi:mas-related G-protein coupled receptor member H-like isoform X1 [Rhineura floridana]|uniref:mas-related G-protein coupled receptor member H-like isoform X1 n=1 Tax=Rhineura floridana TaxID=261503 RepID=UPI002AC8501A|nr:mas-related G-protein coupled receptor member H-like isoform X1 [Rhineura floridana]
MISETPFLTAGVSTPEEAEQQSLSTMANVSPTSLSPLDAGKEYYRAYNETLSSNNSHSNDDPELDYALETHTIFTIIICILGLWGNGTVIWLLGFCIKRNSFTTYILNLAIADFGLLTTTFIRGIQVMGGYFYIPLLSVILLDIFVFMYNTGQFLLTAISISRCVSVLFPLWHRCHRPPLLSTTVCALIWGLSFLLPGIHFTLFLAKLETDEIIFLQLVVNGFLCLPLMTTSTLILFIKVCFKSQQQKKGKLLIAILLTLFFFIIFSFPLNALFITVFVFHSEPPYILFYSDLYACLNSSVNPLIYFLVGRQKRGRPRKSMKAILQNIFKEDENSTVEVVDMEMVI